jgi:hypothetical protein
MSIYVYDKEISGGGDFEGKRRDDRLNIGWLAEGYDFPTGDPGAEFKQALSYALRFGVNATRGSHGCQFCEGMRIEMIDSRGRVGLLGSEELYIEGSDGSAFASPILIVHYVIDHNYLPPDVYRQAVIDYAHSKNKDWKSEDLNYRYQFA